MKEIPLSPAGVAIVDDEDYPALCRHKWFLHAQGYAYRPVREGSVSVGGIYMHRAVMGNPAGNLDHRNRDKLDNRKRNLRVASKSQNGLNGGAPANNTSGHRGVTFERRRNKWNARIKVERRTYQLGLFEDKLDAVRARALAELRFRKQIHGDIKGVV